ncbi:sugar transferase [Chitinophagaceae bacterium LB-8]|uniref:Sugar transferase n=1 Tax=Paraflavisolibacter caeni TaxID=2982496 RepID=A0A9X2XNS2_9BACT|nr:sugar transferase [Paraflavisolibacter caeni]MCU7548969.1 sugar transferase [Paraflavisolibacter caeni]
MDNRNLIKNVGAQQPSEVAIVSVKRNKLSFIKSKKTPLPIKYVGFYSPLDKHVNVVGKRLFDFFLSSIFILFFLSWLIPVFALLIKLDSKGPVFFLQKRYKRNKQLFTCIKFRTMIVNDNADIQVAGFDDARITSIGRFLRKFHLDELPQLFNVCWGDMSIVGPRPYMIIENDNFEEMSISYLFRYKVKPGITGLAQSLGNFGPLMSADKLMERLELDLQYIRKWSVGSDLLIIYRTLLLMISSSNCKYN